MVFYKHILKLNNLLKHQRKCNVYKINVREKRKSIHGKSDAFIERRRRNANGQELYHGTT
jgi:hypothetical protein